MTPAVATTAAAADTNGTKMEVDAAPAPFPPPLVPETLHYRLATGNIGKNGGQRGSLTRCAQKFGTYQSKLLLSQQQQHQSQQPEKMDDGDDKEKEGDNNNSATAAASAPVDTAAAAVETAKRDLLQDLSWYQLEFQKMVLQQRNQHAQVTAHETAFNERLKAIESLQKEVIAGRAKAKESRDRQNCYGEYEALAKLVNCNSNSNSSNTTAKNSTQQTSRTLQLEIQKAQEEIEKLEKQQAEIDQTLRVRECQFQMFLQYMMDLKRSLNENDGGEDDNVNKGVKPGKGAGGNTNDDEEGAVEDDDDDDENLEAMQVDDDEDDEDGLYGDL